MKSKLLLATISTCLLLGCVTPPQTQESTQARPSLPRTQEQTQSRPLTDREYELFSSTLSTAKICEREGLVTSQDFSFFLALHADAFMRNKGADKNRLDAMYASKVEQFANWKPTSSKEKEMLKLRCREMKAIVDNARSR